jgi:hypothetical protein
MSPGTQCIVKVVDADSGDRVYVATITTCEQLLTMLGAFDEVNSAKMEQTK